jgi:hypothetical protein
MESASLHERPRDGQTTRQGRISDLCVGGFFRRHPAHMTYSGDPTAPAIAPVVKSAAASANSIAAVLLQ